MMNLSKKKKLFFTILIFFLTLFRLYLFANTPYSVFPAAGHDHGRLFYYALSMAEGDWLGQYNQYTLIKNIGFSIVLFISYILNLPYGILFGLIVIIVCVLFSVSIKTWISSDYLRGAIYIFMLFCPVAFSSIFGRGVYRNAMVPWLLLGYFSGIIGVYSISSDDSTDQIKRVGWSITAAFFLCSFWFLREDSVWIVPFVVVSGICIITKGLYLFKRKKVGSRYVIGTVASVLLPIIFCIGADASIRYRNYVHYGIAVTTDRTDTGFADFLGDLHHIEDGQALKNVWLSRLQLQMAIDNSETLACYQNEIWNAWDSWAGEGNELPGDIGQWALRDAIASGGGYQDGRTTDLLYKQMDDEIKNAFSDGRLEKRHGIFLSSQTGAFNIDDFWQSFRLSFVVWHSVAKYKYCTLDEFYMEGGDIYDIIIWENYLNMYKVKTDNELSEIGANDKYIKWNNTQKIKQKQIVNIVNIIVGFYSTVSYIITPLFWLSYLIIGFMMIKKQNKNDTHNVELLSEQWVFITGILLCEWVHIYISVLFSRYLDTNLDGSVYHYYNYAPASYIMIQIAEALCITYVSKYIYDLRVKR